MTSLIRVFDADNLLFSTIHALTDMLIKTHLLMRLGLRLDANVLLQVTQQASLRQPKDVCLIYTFLPAFI